MTFTDETRREVAAKLRAKRDEWERPAMWMPQMEGYLERAIVYDIAECIPDGDSLFGVLADLIDRPACHAIAEDRLKPETSTFVCSRCGAGVWADAESMTPYCPMCGAEVRE